MRVEETGPLNGMTVESAGLRRLPGLFLAEIERSGEVLAAVSGQQQLKGGDRLVLFGAVESVPDLRRIEGLTPVVDPHYDFGSRRGRWLTEVVVSPDCPVLGRSIRESDFRGHYGAAVLAVGRGGKRILGKAGDVILRAGDSLLLESQDDFASGNKNSRDFYLVTPVPGFGQVNARLAMLAMAIVIDMVLAVGTGLVDLLPASMIAAIAMVICRCCTAVEARQSIEWSVLLTIAAAFGIASALETSGVATAAAAAIVQLAGERPWALLLAVYVATLLATELVTNNAAAALMFPIAIQTAEGAGLNVLPFAIAVMIAASCGFATPFGYQTNLMVAGPGGYRFMDYVRFGIFLDLLALAVAVSLIPLLWPFAK
jgi:di/tricarboxylate transporter